MAHPARPFGQHRRSVPSPKRCVQQPFDSKRRGVPDVQRDLSQSARASLHSDWPRRVAAAIAATLVALGLLVPAAAPASQSSSQSSSGDPTNLLTGAAATFSGTTGGWVPLNNSSLSWVQTPSTLSTGSLDMSATSTAWVYGASPKVAAIPGVRYTAQASLMTPSSASVAVALAFYDSSGKQINAVAGKSATPAASTWTTLPQAAAVAPSGTRTVALIVAAWTASVGQHFYIESPVLASPTPTVNVDLTNGNSNVLSAPFSQTTTSLGPVSSGTITLDPSKTFQSVDGFGANLTNSSAAVLMSLPSTTRNTVLSNLFDPTKAGISVIRLPMGANDFSANGCSASAQVCPSGNYTYDDPPAGAAANWTDPSLSNFNILPYDQNIVNILHSAQKINPNLTIIASPWTAPPWMKTNAPVTDPYASGSNGRLNPSYYGVYAQYFVKYVQAYAKEGINVNYVTPQNEPGVTTTTYPGMLFSSYQERSFVDNNLAPALTKAGLSTQILGYDWDWKSSSWTTSDVENVLSGAPSNVAGTAWHCYGGDPSTQSTVEASYNYPRWLNFITECSGVGIDSGYGITGSTTVDNFAYHLGLDSQKLIVGGLNNWASGVQLFNVAENQYYGPQNGGCNDCKPVVQVDTNTNAVSYTVDYYVLTEASSVLESGARIISTSSSNGLQAVAGLNPDNTTGLYVSNPSQTSATFTVNDGGEGFTYTIPSLSAASFRWTN